MRKTQPLQLAINSEVVVRNLVERELNASIARSGVIFEQIVGRRVEAKKEKDRETERGRKLLRVQRWKKRQRMMMEFGWRPTKSG